MTDVEFIPPPADAKVGISRLYYFLSLVAITGFLALVGANLSHRAYMTAAIAAQFVAGGLAYLRLKNIGWPWWLCLVAVAPLVNLVLGYVCCVVPPGFARTRRMDPKGISAAISLAILFAALVIMKLRPGEP